MDGNREIVLHAGHLPMYSKPCHSPSWKGSSQNCLMLIGPSLTASAESQGWNWTCNRAVVSSSFQRQVPFQARVRRKPDSIACPTVVSRAPHTGKRHQRVLASKHFHTENDCQHFSGLSKQEGGSKQLNAGAIFNLGSFLREEIIHNLYACSASDTRQAWLQMLINGAASSLLATPGSKSSSHSLTRDCRETLEVWDNLPCVHLCCCCCSRRWSRGFDAHYNFVISCPSSIPFPPMLRAILVAFLQLLALFLAAKVLPTIVWTQWVLHPSGRSSLKGRHFLSLRQFTLLSSLVSTWRKYTFPTLRSPSLAALSFLLALTSFAIISGQMLLAQQGHEPLWTAVLIIGFGRQYLALRPLSSFWFDFYKVHAQGFQLRRLKKTIMIT